MTTTKPRPQRVHKPWFCMRCPKRFSHDEAVALLGRCDRKLKDGRCGGYLSRVRAA